MVSVLHFIPLYIFLTRKYTENNEKKITGLLCEIRPGSVLGSAGAVAKRGIMQPGRQTEQVTVNAAFHLCSTVQWGNIMDIWINNKTLILLISVLVPLFCVMGRG